MVFKVSIILLLSVFIRFTGVAQLCQGSLGDPIVNIIFGSGADPGLPLLAASTTYQYTQSDCPNDGFYSVRNSTVGCYGATWHTINSDHTGDPNGYFMLVNASFQTGAFYVDTVRGLCGSTTYEFASWILNVLVPSSCNGNTIQPNLTFSIEKTDGTVLQTYNSGNIPPSTLAQWRQYGFFFTTPPTVSEVVLRIVNNAPGGCGNDLLLDDITFRPCGPQITSTINASPSTSLSVCEGQSSSYLLSNTVSGGFNTASFQWQQWNTTANTWSDIPGERSNSYTVMINTLTPPGLLRYRLAVAESGNLGSVQCRAYSNSFSIQVNALPATTANNNGPICEGDNIILTATGGTLYSWTGPAGFISSVSPATLVNATVANSGKYFVNVVNAEGCIRKDSTIVLVNMSPIATASFDSILICEGEIVALSASGGDAYSWNPAGTLENPTTSNPIATPLASTRYQAVVSNQAGCSDTVFVKVNVAQFPVANAGPDKLIFSGQTVQLTATASSNTTYHWSPATFINDISVLQPFVNPPRDLPYILEVSSICGTDADTVQVKVFKDLDIPNAFTPNGDGINDNWNIPAIGVHPAFEIRVYGRFGQLVYFAKNAMQPWDGRLKGSPLPMGVYFYQINLNGERNVKGSIMLIR